MKKYKLSNLGPRQLWRLRLDVSLCSLFYRDYKNRYNLDVRAVCDFFDGYADYLDELMQDDGHDTNENFFVLLEKYDTPKNLYNYYSGIEWSVN